jgi:hypothetical protein
VRRIFREAVAGTTFPIRALREPSPMHLDTFEFLRDTLMYRGRNRRAPRQYPNAIGALARAHSDAFASARNTFQAVAICSKE